MYDILVKDKEGKHLAGQVGFQSSRGLRYIIYGLKPEYRGKGLAEQAAKMALRKHQKDRLIVGVINKTNKPSLKLISRLGFQKLPDDQELEARRIGLIPENSDWFYYPPSFHTTKVAEAAPGIPSRSEYGNLSQLSDLIGQLTDFIEHEHEARRAGLHTDLRLAGPEGLYSWAVRKGIPQEPGKSHLAIQQPLHDPAYGSFEGEIPEGQYGAGKVKIRNKSKVLINSVDYDTDGNVAKLGFSLDQAGTPQRLMLSRYKDNQWLLINTTPTVTAADTGFKKPRMRIIRDSELDKYIEQVSKDTPASAKIDGGLGLIRFLKRKAEVLSYRTSVTGDPIYHTERINPRLLAGLNVPKSLQGQVAAGEIHGLKGNQAIPIQELGGIMNSSLAKSRQKIEAENIQMRVALFHLLDRGDLTREQKAQILGQAVDLVPDTFTLPPSVDTPKQARGLLNKIVSGKYPLTSEGMVFDTSPTTKAKYKHFPETDVIVRNILPGEGKYKGTHAGAIQYSLTPEGSIVGNIGTGLSDALRKDLWDNQANYLNRVARIKHQGQFPTSQAFRVPVLLALHEDYPQVKDDRTDWGPEIMERLSGK